MLMRHGFATGALLNGAAAGWARPMASVSLLALALLGFPAWLSRWAEPPAAPRSAFPSMMRTAAAALTIFLLGWVPVLVVAGQGIEPRLCYWPAAAAALAIGALGAATAATRGDTLNGRLTAGAALGVMCVLGAVMMVGVQSALRSRWLLDQRQAAELRALIPNPAPSSIFVPLGVQDRAATTGRSRFDTYFFGPLERPWSAPFYIGRAYHRPGLVAAWTTHFPGWRPTVEPTAGGLLYGDSFLPGSLRLPGAFESGPGGAKLLPWARILPFTLDKSGHVRPVSAMIDDDRDQTYPIPQVAALANLPGTAIRVHWGPGGVIPPAPTP